MLRTGRNLAFLATLFTLTAPTAFADDPCEVLFSVDARPDQTLAPFGNIPLRLKRLMTATEWGPTIRIPFAAHPKFAPVVLDQMGTLTVGSYNVENLLERQGKVLRDAATGDFVRDPIIGDLVRVLPRVKKSDHDLAAIGDAWRRSGAQLGTTIEVENAGSLEVLNEGPLGDRAKTEVIPGNDERGISIGLMLDRNLPLDAETQSYRNVARENSDFPVFSRDFPVTVYRKAGAPADSKPLFITASVHFKSQRGFGPDNFDNGHSLKLRTAEVLAAVEILRAYQTFYGPKVPILVMGDFNSDVRSSPEFKPLWDAGFMDGFDIAPAANSVAKNDRITQNFFPNGEEPKRSQLDAILGSSIVSQRKLVLAAGIVPYLDANGAPKGAPQNYREKNAQPSDHNMVWLKLDFNALLKLYDEP